jgi:cytochrome o ubiquinol oxidase subunit 2
MIVVFQYRDSIEMWNPKGLIALKQLDLMVVVTLLMLIVVIPVFIMTVFFVWKYRASNKKAPYTPDYDHNVMAEVVWWGFPLVIVVFLSVIAWQSSHELDPYKPIETDKKPLTIQVVALQWKWLFIYPEQNIATVNFVQFPEKTPINFEISADAPMNSFWIPQLGGQIYAMPGMRTKLHIIADEPGNFTGSSANLSGEGFAGMTFKLKASSQEEFDQWVKSVKQSSESLGMNEYAALAKPSSYNPVATYVLGDATLFDWIVMKPMMPPSPKPGVEMKKMNHLEYHD